MRSRNGWLGGLLAALALAAVLSPWASPSHDGLDRVAQRLVFFQRERPLIASPLADYRLPARRAAGWSTAAAGVTGTLAVFGGVYLLGFALTRRRSGR